MTDSPTRAADQTKRPRGATTEVPLRRQYLQIKARFPDTILFFRLGDFYETFDGDAEIAADVLDIVLTGRDMGKGMRVPMAGIPYHAAEGYIARLITAGHKVAICEQIGEATKGRGLADQGKLLHAGPFADDLGSLIVYEAGSADEVQVILNNDPFSKEGIITDSVIREWNRVLP